MKSLIITTILAASAFAASAQSGNGETYGHNSPTVGTSLTRAEVLADLREALNMDAIAYGDLAQAESTNGRAVSREKVTADLRAAQEAGTIRFGEM